MIGFLPIVQYLIEKGANIEGKTPPHIACKNGHLPVAQYLVEIRANIEAKDSNEQTPLHYTSRWDKTDIAKYLVSKGAKPCHYEELLQFSLIMFSETDV